MLFELPGLDRQVWITAFRDTVDPSRLAKFQVEHPEVTIQLFDLDRVAGSRHILLATFNAVKSYKSKRRISRSLAMEILLFVSGTRQISEAVKRVGVSPQTRRTAALSLSSMNADQSKIAKFLTGIFKDKGDDSLLEKWTSLRRATVLKTFGIGKKELKATRRSHERTERAIERLAIERSAMLAIAK